MLYRLVLTSLQKNVNLYSSQSKKLASSENYP